MDESSDQPDLELPPLLDQSPGAVHQAFVRHDQRHDQEERIQNDDGQGALDESPVEEEAPDEVAAVGEGVGPEEQGRENVRRGVERLVVAVLAEEVDHAVEHPEGLPGVDNSPDGEGPVCGSDVQVVLLRLLALGGDEQTIWRTGKMKTD